MIKRSSDFSQLEAFCCDVMLDESDDSIGNPSSQTKADSYVGSHCNSTTFFVRLRGIPSSKKRAFEANLVFDPVWPKKIAKV